MPRLRRYPHNLLSNFQKLYNYHQVLFHNIFNAALEQELAEEIENIEYYTYPEGNE